MSAAGLVAEHGKSVTIRYTISLEDGTNIGESVTKPFSFRIGGKKVIPALEDGVLGMQVNELRKVPVAAEQGYGEYNDDLVLKVDRKMFPDDLRLYPGRALQYQTRNGERANFVVREVENETVVIDANHPLAGQDLVYEVELLEVS